MPVQAAHRLEPPQAYTASKARQPPKLPRHRPYASCETCPTQLRAAKRASCGPRAKRARFSEKEIYSTYTLQPRRQRSPACAATFTLSCPPALPPAGIAAGTEPAAACALARVPRMECERTSGQRSRQPRQHSRRLRPRGANCGHCPVRRSVACGHTGLQRCRGSASNHGGCAVQRPPGRCS